MQTWKWFLPVLALFAFVSAPAEALTILKKPTISGKWMVEGKVAASGVEYTGTMYINETKTKIPFYKRPDIWRTPPIIPDGSTPPIMPWPIAPPPIYKTRYFVSGRYKNKKTGRAIVTFSSQEAKFTGSKLTFKFPLLNKPNRSGQMPMADVSLSYSKGTFNGGWNTTGKLAGQERWARQIIKPIPVPVSQKDIAGKWEVEGKVKYLNFKYKGDIVVKTSYPKPIYRPTGSTSAKKIHLHPQPRYTVSGTLKSAKTDKVWVSFANQPAKFNGKTLSYEFPIVQSAGMLANLKNIKNVKIGITFKHPLTKAVASLNLAKDDKKFTGGWKDDKYSFIKATETWTRPKKDLVGDDGDSDGDDGSTDGNDDTSGDKSQLATRVQLNPKEFWANKMPGVHQQSQNGAKTSPPAAQPKYLNVRLQILNRGQKPVEFKFTSGQTYDVQILDGSGKVVYTWSANRMFTQALRSKTLQPGKVATFTEKIKIYPNKVPEGTYTVKFFITGTPQVGGTATFKVSYAH